MKKFVFLFFSLNFLNCQNLVQPIALSEGKWGGEQIMMNVSVDKINFTWGCATAEILEKVSVLKGEFSVLGTYQRGAGILPADPSLWPKPQIARFDGILNGKTLNFKVTLVDGKTELGSYTVVLNQEEKIFYCL